MRCCSAVSGLCRRGALLPLHWPAPAVAARPPRELQVAENIVHARALFTNHLHASQLELRVKCPSLFLGHAPPGRIPPVEVSVASISTKGRFPGRDGISSVAIGLGGLLGGLREEGSESRIKSHGTKDACSAKIAFLSVPPRLKKTQKNPAGHCSCRVFSFSAQYPSTWRLQDVSPRRIRRWGSFEGATPWEARKALQFATLEWVSGFNLQRLLAPIGYLPPAEAEANSDRQLASQATANHAVVMPDI